MKKIALLTVVILISGCSIFRPYRPDIQQGNITTADQAAQIHTGMTTDQVTNILGTPVLHNIFNDGRMVYVYELYPNRGVNVHKMLSIELVNGRVASIDKTGY